MQPASKPRWQQVTALVSLSAGGAITGFSFVPKAAPDLISPNSMPIRLLALKQAARPAPADDATLRSAIVNVAQYYLRMAEGKTPAEMEAIIWQHDSIDGVDHGESCAAFASLTLELAAQVVGQQSWVTGGTSYPWPLHKWADVRVDPNPASLGVTSVLQDAEAHHRWHPLDDGYAPLPGDWVLFNGHVEVVTKYAGGVLDTVGGDSLPNLSVNAHEYRDPLGAQGVVGFVNNGDLPGTAARTPRSGEHAPGGQQAQDQADPGLAAIPGAAAASSPQHVHARPRDRATVPAAPAPSASPASSASPGSSSSASPTASSSASPTASSSASPSPRSSSGSYTSASVSPSPRPGRRSGSGQDGRSARRQPRRGTGHAPAGVQAPGQARPGAAATADVPGAGPAEPAAASRAAAPGAAAIPGLAVTAHQLSDDSAASSTAPYSRHRPPPATTPLYDTSAQQAFIAEVAPGAVAAQRRYGVPAAVTIAQAIDESGWGQSSLATQDHNLFGIKGTGPAGRDLQPSREYENGQSVTHTSSFRVYHNVAESINDHGKLLATSGYYRQAMADRRYPNAFAADLTGVYATDPDYGVKLVALMRRYNLYRYDVTVPAATQAAATGGAVIPGLPPVSPAPQASTPPPAAAAAAAAATPASVPTSARASSSAPAAQAPAPTSVSAAPAPAPTPASSSAPATPARAPTSASASASAAAAGPDRQADADRHPQHAGPSTQTVSARRVPGSSARPRAASRPVRASTSQYRPHIPPSVRNAFAAMARVPLLQAEPLYRDVASHSGIRWELLAACDWMQCRAQSRYSPVHGEKLGTANPGGTIYRTKSEALEQCADDLAELAWAVYRIDLTAAAKLSVRDLANVFAAFRWGGLLKVHHTSALEFPYSVAGLTVQHLGMRWPNIAEPNAPDKPGSRFRMPFGAVPIVLGLNYPATD